MKRKQAKRLHSEDAKFLRQMFVDALARILELEYAVGDLQARLPIREEIPAEVLEGCAV